MKDVVKELATKYNKDIRVIEAIVNHPFLFLKRRAEDVNDDKMIRILYFGLFKLKSTKTIANKEKHKELKENRLLNYLTRRNNS